MSDLKTLHQEARRVVRSRMPRTVVSAISRTQPGYPQSQLYPALHTLMRRYETDKLVNVTPEVFEREIKRFMTLEDAEMEGFADPSKQRDLSIKFHWGHDQDFGTFAVKGMLGDRHITLVAAIVDWLHALPLDLRGKRILDIGCWSGGTSLLLHAMGAEVVAVEEVKKYVDCLAYLGDSFDLEGLVPLSRSLYECTGEGYDDRFDAVLFAGVLYHVTDPIVALRIVFNALKDGGTCILETAVAHSGRRALDYHGPTAIVNGTAEQLNRGGWNWFLPSPATLRQMMLDVGFTNVRLTKVIGSSAGPRIIAIAERDRHCDMLRAGLSVRDLR